MSPTLQTTLTALGLIPTLAHAAGLGSWGPTIEFPLVPAAAAVIPTTGNLVVWSAYSVNAYAVAKSGQTKTAEYNPSTGAVSALTISNTNHDMFCPGISMDFNGQLIVTGGDTANKTSIHVPGSDTWTTGPVMNIPRGYQSSTTTSEGKTFTIGGSWSGGYGGKNGEILSATDSTWTLLPGCSVTPMLTADAQGIFRQDNHAWLYSWSNGTVFQGGPSKAMNWYTTTGSYGGVKAAGTRGSDKDAMTGVNVMYDAVAGKIFSAGGSPSYQQSYATTNAQLITITKANITATVTTLTPMSYARAFANAIVLPNGQVFIVGGQTYAVPFSDGNSSMIPEMWDPTTLKFTPMATIPTPRNYHSVGLLMPDATVFSGGGGLCGTACTTNHEDGQFYSPPYLFAADGVTKATRPSISSVSATTLAVGANLTATLNTSLPYTSANFSMIRIGSSTHTVNTDQRRIVLTPTVASGVSAGNGTSGWKYTLKLPTDPGIVLPGYWYLFALVGGVPSIASILKVTL